MLIELSDDTDSDSDGDTEPPHPLGFGGTDRSSPWGKTWISLDPPSRSRYSPKGRSRYALEDDEDNAQRFVQSYPPLSTYISSENVLTAALLRSGAEVAVAWTSPQPHRTRSGLRSRRDTDDDLYYSSAEDDDEDEEHDDEEHKYEENYSDHEYPERDTDEDEASDVALLFEHSYQGLQFTPPRLRLMGSPSAPSLFASPEEIRQKRDATDRRIQRRVEAERLRIDEECRQTAAILGELVLQSNKEADGILQKQKAEEERLAKVQMAKEAREHKLREQAERETALRREQADQEASEQQRVAQAKRDERKAHEAATEKKRNEAEARVKRKTEHIDKAKKLVGQLLQVRASVEPFEKNKAVGKRRLGMKKIAKGKVNTLNDNPGKITEVAAEISQAIARYDQEDAQIKQQLQQKVPGMTPDMAVGRRYFVDLLASTAMLRVQAESFNGTKGDGFPLAAMLAMVSVENKNIIAVLAAHIYTVCPTAIPTLPKPKADASEDEVMVGLGMQRNKKTGDFESFPQFLARTENIVSFVASIQSSLPSSHQLMGGNTGALLWLKRFLDLMPPAPTAPLPLITAPVLGAFLTCAGHMLANVHPENFRKLLTKIEADIVHRLDEGEIGKPSSIRLSKVLEKGFEGFAKNLPAKAISELYGGASADSQKHEAVTSFAGTIGGEESVQPKRNLVPPKPQHQNQRNQHQNRNQQQQQQQSNPFGGGGGGLGGSNNNNNNPQQSASPFGGPASNSNAFGGNSAQNQSPFGGGSAATAPSPFGGPSSGFGGAASSSPFGGASNSNSMSMQQEQQQQQQQHPPQGSQQSAPFGAFSSSSTNPATGQSPFGGGGGMASSPSPFGGGGGMSAAPSPSPFGGGGAPSQSPFGGAAPLPFACVPAPSPSPFGATGNSGNPSPFGGGGNAMQQGNNQQNSYQGGGGNSQQQNTPYGGGGRKKGPCKFFAQGKCRNGANCQFSHETGGSGGGSSFGNQGFQSNNNNNGGRSNQGFGSNDSSGGRGNQGFGSSSGGRGGGKKPCHFFAQGRCKKGNNCPFSHDTGGGGGGGGGFGGGNNSWGGSR